MKDYIPKLESLLGNAIRVQLLNDREVNLKRGGQIFFDKIDYVSIALLNFDLNVKHFSGNEFTANANGHFGVWAKNEDGASLKYVDFWIRDVELRFNVNIDDFEVVELPKILALDYKQY